MAREFRSHSSHWGAFEAEVSDGTVVAIHPYDIEIQTENIEGWVVESDGSLTVALDTKLDAQLVNEGLAREFVNKVQNLRKERSLGVNDRIKIKYDCGSELEAAIAAQKKYIEDETMAVELNFDRTGKLNGFEELNINGNNCKVTIEKI